MPLRGGAFGGEDAGDSGKIVGYVEIRPLGRFEEGADGGKTVVPEFKDEETADSEIARGFWDQQAVKLVAFFATVEGGGGFVVADFDGEGAGFFAADVGWVRDDEIEEK